MSKFCRAHIVDRTPEELETRRQELLAKQSNGSLGTGGTEELSRIQSRQLVHQRIDATRNAKT